MRGEVVRMLRALRIAVVSLAAIVLLTQSVSLPMKLVRANGLAEAIARPQEDNVTAFIRELTPLRNHLSAVPVVGYETEASLAGQPIVMERCYIAQYAMAPTLLDYRRKHPMTLVIMPPDHAASLDRMIAEGRWRVIVRSAPASAVLQEVQAAP